MIVSMYISKFLAEDRGAVTVDWTVISSAAVGLAVATTAIMTDSIDVLSMRMDDELRTRQLSDNWVQFAPVHFQPILATGAITQSQAEAVYDMADELMNYDLISNVTAGIEALEAGTITGEELVGLVALASVAYQRNVIDDGTLNYYFSFDDPEAVPHYMVLADAVMTGS